MLMRSGTGPSEPCEIANFDPIHARVTTPVFPISISADLSRSTARYAIGVSLFLPPFFFSFFFLLAPSCAASAVGDDGDFGFAPRDDDARVCAGTGIAGARLVFTFRGRTFSFSFCNRDAPACLAAICHRGIAPC